MNQVKKYLELYVQWIALGLGAAFLLWMVYDYIVQHPVTAPVGSASEVAPGDIDTTIWTEKGKPLQDQVSSTDVPNNMPDVKDIVAQVQTELDSSPQFALAGPYTPLTPPIDIDSSSTSVPTVPREAQVTKLPVPPAIIDLQISGGHSNVPAPVLAAQGAGGAAPAPIPVLAPAPGGPQVAAVDKSWRTVSGRIPVAALNKAMRDAKIPTKLNSTSILRVELIRQEEDASGQFGPQEGIEIPTLSCNQVPPLPPAAAPSGPQSFYQQWAETNYTLVMQPPFFQVLQGDIWYLPGTKNPNEVQVQMVAFDPAAFAARNGDPSTLSPDDRKIWDAWKHAQQVAAAAARRAAQQHNTPNQPPGIPNDEPGGNNNNGGNGNGNGGGRGGGRGGGGRGRSGLAADPDRPTQLPPSIPPPEPGMMIPPSGFGGPSPEQQRPTADTTAEQAAAATLPHGSFDPSQQPGDIVVWAHDDTVQAGKTYRYKLRYVITNPVAHSNGLCNPQSLAKQYQIVSLDSAWTDKVIVESDTNFYAVNAFPNRDEVTFDVFHWKDGVWQKQTVKVRPGDMVGGIDPATKTDFATGWTLVDVRTDPRDESAVTILLASDNGTILKKDKNNDLHNAEYQKLLNLTAKEAPKTASAQPLQ
jgi:hypothetical protein